MSRTISRLFDLYDDARAAVALLEASGVPRGDISVVSRQTDDRYNDAQELRREHDAASEAMTGAGIGGAMGGTAGLLAGLGVLAIPGIGPVVAAGWLAAAAVGAVAGAAVGGAAGGIVGALTDAGVHPDDASLYAEGLRRGATLVTARVDDGRVAELEAVLDRYPAVDLQHRRHLYQGSGWQRFDAAGHPLSDVELRAERARLR